jgi:hypothetical protein
LVQNSPLPPNTIVPESQDLFLPWINRLYEDIAFAVNNKDNIFFPMSITNVATDIPNLPNFGAFLICVSGSTSITNPSTNVVNWLPTLTASLCKSKNDAAGSVAVLGSQAGTGDIWAGIVLTITSTNNNFQIAHNLAGTSGNFNIKFIGTNQ